jgi:hypothetical protein
LHTTEKPVAEAKFLGYYCRPDETIRFVAMLLSVVLGLALASLVLSGTAPAPTQHRAPDHQAPGMTAKPEVATR